MLYEASQGSNRKRSQIPSNHRLGLTVSRCPRTQFLVPPTQKLLDNSYTDMITYIMLARQITLLDSLSAKLTPLLRYSCRLFVAPKKVNSFGIKQIQTLSAKYRGWGYLAQFGTDFCAAMPHFCQPFVFMVLRIAFPATPFPSQTSALPPGVYPSQTKFPNQESSRRSSAFSAPARHRAGLSVIFYSSDFPSRSNVPTFRPAARFQLECL